MDEYTRLNRAEDMVNHLQKENESLEDSCRAYEVEIAELKRKNELLHAIAKNVIENSWYFNGDQAECFCCKGVLNTKGLFVHDDDCKLFLDIISAHEGGAI